MANVDGHLVSNLHLYKYSCIFFSSDNFAWKSTHKNKSCMVLPNSSRFSRNFSENIAKISDFIFAKFRDIQDNFVQISCFMKF